MAGMTLGTSGGAFSISGLMQQLQSQQDAANAANDKRYNQSLSNQATQHGAAEGMYNQANADIANIGQAGGQRIDLNAQKAAAMGQQSLVGRGLGNTTIRDSVARGYADDAELQHQGLDEQVGREKAGLLTQQAGYENQYANQLSGVYESRNDVAPNTDLYAGLIQQAMAGQTNAANKPTTTNYVGSDGRSYNSPGAALASSHSGGSSGGGMGGGGIVNKPSSSVGGGGGGGGGASGGGGGGGWNIPQGGFSNYEDSLPGGGGGGDNSSSASSPSAPTNEPNDGMAQGGNGVQPGGQYSYGNDGWIGYKNPDGSWVVINPGTGGNGQI